MESSPQVRAFEIDGIRGWASMLVLVYHSFHEMLSRLLPWLNKAWFAPVFDGRLAVCVFFVLSGDALTAGFWARGGADSRSIDRLLLRRYTRLSIPILMSSLLVYLVCLAGADWHREAAIITQRPDWIADCLNFQMSLAGLVRFSLLGVYSNYSKATSYNPFLWTMSVEIVGSMLIFLSCYVWPRLRNGAALLIGVTLFLFFLGSFLSLFFAGMYLGLLRERRFFDTRVAGAGWQAAGLAAVLSLTFLLMAATGHQKPLVLDYFIATSLVFIVYGQRQLRKAMCNRVSLWLGDISFPLYFVQFAVIISLESWLIVQWKLRGASDQWLLSFGVAAVAATIVIASVLRVVERRVLHMVDGFILRSLRAG